MKHKLPPKEVCTGKLMAVIPAKVCLNCRRRKCLCDFSAENRKVRYEN
jgi:hypothetical protein